MANSPKLNVSMLRVFLCMTTAGDASFCEDQGDKEIILSELRLPASLKHIRRSFCTISTWSWFCLDFSSECESDPAVTSDCANALLVWAEAELGLPLHISICSNARWQISPINSHSWKKGPLLSNAAATSSKHTVLNPSSSIFHSTDLQIHLAASAAFSAHNLCACFKLWVETVTLNDWHAWCGVLDFPACTCPLCVLLCRHLLSRLLKLIAAFLPLSPPRHSLHAAALSP